MKAKDLLVIGCTALVTALASGWILQPAKTANAVPKQAAILRAAPAVLENDGIELSLKANKQTYKPGDKPVMTLTAVNTCAQPKSVEVKVRMLASSPASKYARMVSLPTENWTDTLLVALKANERKTLVLPTDAKLSAGKDVFFTLQVDQQVIRAAGFFVEAEKIPTKLAALQAP